jgi:hypothetical protein
VGKEDASPAVFSAGMSAWLCSLFADTIGQPFDCGGLLPRAWTARSMDCQPHHECHQQKHEKECMKNEHTSVD